MADDPARPSVYERMLTIMRLLPAIGKDTQNPEQNFMFRSHDQILNALNPLLSEHGVFIVPDVMERVTDQRATKRGSIMYEVNLHVRYRFYGPDGVYVEASTWGEGTDMGDKATNKAMTMAFKNVLNQAFAISSAEFKDADAESPEETVHREEETASKRERMISRIAGLTEQLDEQTGSDAGTWAQLTQDGSVRDWEVDLDKVPDAALEEIGLTLKAKLDGGVREAPDQLNFEIPF